MKKFLDRIVQIVDFAQTRPIVVLALSLLATFGAWSYAYVHRDLRTDMRELVPSDSPGYKAFEHQLGRIGGGATLVVVADSPDRAKNRKFIDDFSAKLAEIVKSHSTCIHACAGDAACVQRCGPQLMNYVDSGTKDVHAFFEANKWLYADLKDLEDADQTIDEQIAIESNLVPNLLDDDEPKKPKEAGSAATPPTKDGANKDTANKEGNPQVEKKSALGIDKFRERWKDHAKKYDYFPTGYFETEDGRLVALRVISRSAGMGDRGGDSLLTQFQKIAADMNPPSYHPEMKVGFAGDIANVVAEKESVASEVAWASGVAFLLIIIGVIFFYRTAWALIVIAIPVVLGVGCAYAFAMWRYGYVNQVGLFLGAIVLGNGINYPIVLLSRYMEFRARGQSPEEARRTAVQNALRAEFVGACVAAIAYGSLTITRFRGFSQFGTVGFVGMLLVWASIIPVVPAVITLIERIDPKWLHPSRSETGSAEGNRGPISGWVAKVTERAPWAFVTGGVVLTILSVIGLPRYFKDPWEYDFDKLGSRGSKHGGAGEWSDKADKVFRGRLNISGAQMLADSPEQVVLIKDQIFKNDAQDPEGRLIKEITTINDILPGTKDEQKAKLEVLERIRDRLTERVLFEMPEDERARVLEMKPPESLHVIDGTDLPNLMRRPFQEDNGTLGTVFYVDYFNFSAKAPISYSDGRILLRIAKTTDNIRLPDGNVVQTASRSTIFAEVIRSMERDGPLATATSFLAVAIVVLFATHNLRGGISVLIVLVCGVLWMLGYAASADIKLQYANFIALPITFGIGCEYPFNIYDRSRLLKNDVTLAVKRVGGAVMLCSYTTIIGYGSLLFADLQALQYFGKLAMAGEITCLIAAIFVLPSILHLLNRRAARQKSPPVVQAETVSGK